MRAFGLLSCDSSVWILLAGFGTERAYSLLGEIGCPVYGPFVEEVSDGIGAITHCRAGTRSEVDGTHAGARAAGQARLAASSEVDDPRPVGVAYRLAPCQCRAMPPPDEVLLKERFSFVLNGEPVT